VPTSRLQPPPSFAPPAPEGRLLTERDVIELYDALCAQGITIWIDGGWCVDALLGGQTRHHADLDIAVRRGDERAARAVLLSLGFVEAANDGSSEWNYAMADASNRCVDVHVFDHDERGRNTYGVAYPGGSLSGTGLLAGREVRCVAAHWMFAFKTGYPPSDKDRHDVNALAERFGFPVPETHRRLMPST
jgi:lincosamide nucleotidyltransferase A/C/D/E